MFNQNRVDRAILRAFCGLVLYATVTGASPDAALDTTANLPQAQVTFLLPPALAVGDTPGLEVLVTPAQGQPPPARVRGRIGMPDMGHWITEEAGVDFSSDGHRFSGEFPHPGLYRFRIWLDYDDGATIKTAIDFTVATGHELLPQVVP